MEGFPFRKFERHHLTEGYRLGHRFSIPICAWHHRGVSTPDSDALAMEAIYGPSLALNKKKFIEVFGTERNLCEKVDELLGYGKTPWPASKIMRTGT
jgi:hypothetical protein